jgi:uncharacterized protein
MNRLDTLISLVKPYYQSEDPAHDWAHVLRVASNAEIICKNLKIGTEIPLAGAYCHDLINLPKDHPERKKASFLSAEAAKKLLIESGFSIDEIILIQSAIIEHSYSAGAKASSLESEIVQDADRLDALGAIGILRCAAVNTKMKSSFYHFEDPLAQGREYNDKNYMLDHYFVKLFKLPELMNTLPAKKLALERVEFMKKFLDQMMNEVRNQDVDH